MITTYSSRDYRITYQGIALIENALERPDLVQVSVVSGCTILVAPQKEYGIDYEPNGEYRSWYMQGVNTRLARAEAHFIYARLNRIDRDALLLFSVNDYTIDGKINGEGEASEDYYYIKIGSITATDLVINPTLDREITIDFGYLTTAAGNEGSASAWRELFDVTADNLIRPLKQFTSFVVKGTLSIIGKIVLNDKEITDVARQGDQEGFIASDDILPTTKLLTGKYLEELRKVLLSKDRIDSTEYLLKLLGGILTTDIKTENFSLGALGSGYGLLGKDSTGKSYLEIDKIFVRLKAIFATLEIMELTYSGGNYIFSPAGARCTKVEDKGTYYRCYFTADDGSKKVKNKFRIDDFVQCREFNVQEGVHENVANRYYWRRCVSVGEDYIDLSKTDRDMSSDDTPAVGDNMVTIGNKTDSTRQNAIIISVYGEGSPSFIQYKGINSFSLDGKAKTIISPERNEFRGTFPFESGEDVRDYVDGEFTAIKTDVAQLKIDAGEIILSVSSVEQKVVTAQSTADSANSAAATAKSAADKAQSTADTAQSTANSANAAIATVKEDVAQLKIDSDEISLSVSSVEQKVTTAQSTADSAKSAAATAQSTANAANSSVDTVKKEVSSLKVQVGSISSTVSKFEDGNELVSIINQTATSIKLSAQRININGTVSANGTFKISTDGYVDCQGGKIGGFSITDYQLKSYNDDASIVINRSEGDSTIISSASSNVYVYNKYLQYGVYINTPVQKSGSSLFLRSTNSNSGYAIECYGGSVFYGTSQNPIRIHGLLLNSIGVSGSYTVKASDDIIRCGGGTTLYLSNLSGSEYNGKILIVKYMGISGGVRIVGPIITQDRYSVASELQFSDYPPRILVKISDGWIEISGKH